MKPSAPRTTSSPPLPLAISVATMRDVGRSLAYEKTAPGEPLKGFPERPNQGDRARPAADASDRHSNPRDPARNATSVRVLTTRFEKMRLTCDFTVSSEISRIRAMSLLAKP
jgi:hypothetical protein